MTQEAPLTADAPDGVTAKLQPAQVNGRQPIGARAAAAPGPKTDWLKLAAAISSDLRATAVERERNLQRPVEELRRFRETRLVNLLIPAKFGGEGESILVSSQVVRELCKGDTSVGALLGYHYINSAIPRYFDLIGDAEDIECRSAFGHWLWGNVTAAFEQNLFAYPAGDGFVLRGRKQFCTGPSLGDVTTVMVRRADKKELLFAYIPTDRKGLVYHNDWNHLGFRLTETVGITFDSVEVYPDEIIRSGDGEPTLTFPHFYIGAGEIFFAQFLLGAALGALETPLEQRDAESARSHNTARSFYRSVVYAELWVKLQAAIALSDRAAERMQAVYDRRRVATARERGEADVIALAARALAIKISLEVTQKIFDVTGIQAASATYGLDRFWRDARAHSLHDPLAHKLRQIGDYALNGVVHDMPPLV